MRKSKKPSIIKIRFRSCLLYTSEDGKWGFKQRRVYRLDEDGNRILDEKGKPLFDAVPTTDWGSPETLEHWRETWAKMCNAKFEEKGLPCRIDHRSYLRQGLDLLPTVHEGPACLLYTSITIYALV